MTAALIAEYRKLFSTRMWWILALILAAYLAFIGASMGFALGYEPPDATPEQTALLPQGAAAASTVYSAVNAVGYVFPLLIGSLAMTGEFRHQTITQSLLVEPSRTTFLLAKLVSTVPVGLLYAVIGVAGIVVGGAPVLALVGDGAYLTDPDVLEVFGLALLVMVLWTMIGVGIGTVIPHQVAAIVVVIGLTQFVEPILRVGLGLFDATAGLAKFFPGAAGDAVLGSSLFGTMMGEGGGTDLLSRPAGAAVMVAYAVVLAALGRLTTLRRDIG